MRLQECLGLGQLLQGDPACEFTGVAYDSRKVGPGSIFVAVPGFRTDGHAFVADAVARGATGVVVEHPVVVPSHVAQIQVASASRALGALAARYYRWPARHLRVIGVTGTNGKTTTTHLIRDILMAQGRRVGLIGTVHNFIGTQELPSSLTTPQASDVQELLHRMVAAGCTHVVMEASSEGLAMHRVDDVEFDIAVFTNLTQDHLNYHGTFELYREAKLSLFRQLAQPGVKRPKAAVINGDDPVAAHFIAAAGAPVHLYGLDDRSAYYARDVAVRATGSDALVVTPIGELPFSLQLAGRFNMYNALAAVTVGLLEGVPLPVIRGALERTSGVAGRMEAVVAGQPFGLFVDYAHSPDGLANVLRTAQGFARGRVIAVFGCGGDRDRTKRPIMGRIAAELADYTILTADNPRTEDPAAILKEIEAGMLEVLESGECYELEVDRTKAIARAIALADPDDVIIVAGKGHETYQIFRDQTIAFDDRVVARHLIKARMAQKEGA